MSYEVIESHGRTIFMFEDEELSYEQLVQAIDRLIQPTSRSDEELTSWTVAFVFEKGPVAVYFEHFYSPDHSFSFELYPLKTNDPEKLAILRGWVEQLDIYLFG